MDLKTKFHFRNNFFEKPRSYNDLLIYQIGEALCEISTELNNHTHLEWFELSYVLSGKGEIFTNNIGSPVSKGDIYISLPKEIHRIASDNSEPLRYFFVAFNVAENSPFAPLLERCLSLIANEKMRVYHSDSVLWHFQHLLFEFKQQSSIQNLIFEHELKTVILKVLAMIEPGDSAPYRPQHNNKQLLCFNIMDYIDRNITSMENAMCLSDVFGYNYTYLSRFFKKVTGENISSYITNKKLNLAKNMLEDGNLSVTEIANELLYSSIHVFSRAFKDKFHMSPSEYKLHFRKKRRGTDLD